MIKLLNTMLSRLDAGEPAVLCSILADSGSSPRGAGAKMAVLKDGTTCGTIGGGAVELLAAKRALDALERGTSSLCAFDLSPNQVNDIGMICGGAVTVYFQYFDPQDKPAADTLRKWLDALENEKDAWLYLALDDSRVQEFEIFSAPPADKAGLFGAKAKFSGSSPMYYTEPVSRPGRVWIFGGGHVGAALVPVLSALDFRVCVFDNRPDFAVQERFPEAKAVACGDYSNLGISLTKNDFAVIMTPGHQADYEVLTQVLRTDAAYVGCIGSKKKTARTVERLRDDGFTDADIARLHAPIGLDILAETPAEIAVSIAAELIRCRKELL